MADFSVTISNAINVFGIAPPNKWGSFNWNAFTWGEGTADLETIVFKVLDNSISSDTSHVFQPEHHLTETVTLDGDMGSQTLRDGSGYAYVFPDRTTDGEARDFNTWTARTASQATWTTASVASTTWSEA